MKTSSLASPSLYAVGTTLNPARRGESPDTGLTTKPDWESRFSTLHSAHLPVRGQGDEACAPEVAATAATPLLRLVPLARLDSVFAASREDLLHPATRAQITI